LTPLASSSFGSTTIMFVIGPPPFFCLVDSSCNYSTPRIRKTTRFYAASFAHVRGGDSIRVTLRRIVTPLLQKKGLF